MYPIYVLLVFLSPKFQSVSLCDLQFCRYRPFWDKSPNDFKMTSNTTMSKVPHIYVLLVSPSPKFQSMSLYDEPFFELQAIWRQMHRMIPQMTLNTIKVNGIPYVLIVSPSPKLQFVSLCNQPFYRKCTELPQDDLKHSIVKSTLYTLDKYPRCPNLVSFALWPTIFKTRCCWK